MIAKYSVKKPYTVLVGVILVLVLGVVSVTRMVTDLLPDMSFPYVLIITVDPGATPEEVEKDVTAPIEAAMASTTNIKSIRSNSNNSYSIVILEFEQNTNMDSCMIELQQSIDLATAGFPDTINTPNILQIDPGMIPIMAVAASYEGMNELELTRFANDELLPAIESVEGAASVNSVSSAGDEIIDIVINKDKLSELNKKIEASIKDKFNEAKGGINSGKKQIGDARAEMNSGSQQLSSTINEVLSAKTELIKTKEELANQKKELVTQRENLNTLLSAINGIEAGIESMMGGSLDYTNPAISSIPISGIPGLSELQNGLAILNISFTKVGDIPVAKSAISGLITQINSGIAMIDEGQKQIEAGEIELNDGLDVLNANASIAAIQIGIGAGALAEAAAGINMAEGQIESAETSALEGADLNGILTIENLSNIIMAQNFDMPAGYVNDNDKQYMIRVTNKVTDMDELKNLVLMDMGFDNMDAIRLSNVCDVDLIEEDTEGYAIVNGNPGVLLSMQKQTGYSTGEASRNLKKSFEALEKEFEGLHLDILMDQSVYISIIVKSVLQNIILGALLACIVLFIFLRSLRPTVIIALSIPLSVITAITLMYFTGISLNIISLSGLALAIGMLVDNSIVAVENVYRLYGEGYSVKEAAIQGVNEIAGAITASTLTTVSVYAPIIFTEGLTRQLFVDIALTILYTLMASLVVALTIVPAMAGSIMKNPVKEQNEKYIGLLDKYESVLKWTLSHKLIAFALAIVILAGSGIACYSRGLDFLDMDVEADQLSASISAPEGKDFDFETLSQRTDEVLDAIKDVEGVETIGAMGGGSSAVSFMGGSDSISLYLVLSEDNKRTLNEISDEIKELTKDIDAKVSITTDSTDYTSFFASGISVEIKGREIDTMRDLAKEVSSVMETVDGISEIDDGSDEEQPEYRITVDREKAAKYSYTVAQVFALIAAELAPSRSATSVNMDPNEYEVYIKTQEQSDVVLSDIENMTFEYKNSDGEKEDIPLSEICTFEKTGTLSSITRSGQMRTLTVSGTIKDSENVTLVADKLSESIDKINVPEGYEINMTGEDETIRDAMKQMLLMMLLAVIFIYLIMVAQFQSLKSPFIIMFTMPLAFTGGFISLLITRTTLNVIAMLGFIMLAGLIVNNGIVLIDYINRQIEDGMSKAEAIVNAGRVRLRPVLMTVLTTILSVSTIALGMGEGSKMMQPMAIVLIGGLIYGTLLTLIIVPCIYDLFHRKIS